MAESPPAPGQRLLIEAYGPGRLRIGGVVHQRPVIVLPGAVIEWPIDSIAALSRESLAAVIGAAPKVEILIVGCGARLVPVLPTLRQDLRAAGLSIDTMDTGAACRTYNVLLAEGRRVAAALIPLPIVP